jgi:hypothetical protein
MRLQSKSGGSERSATENDKWGLPVPKDLLDAARSILTLLLSAHAQPDKSARADCSPAPKQRCHRCSPSAADKQVIGPPPAASPRRIRPSPRNERQQAEVMINTSPTHVPSLLDRLQLVALARALAAYRISWKCAVFYARRRQISSIPTYQLYTTRY